MISTSYTSSHLPVNDSSDLAYAKALSRVEQLEFSGELILTAATGQKWSFYLSQGMILYATGGVHPVRRWRRSLLRHCPQLPTYRLAWQAALKGMQAEDFQPCWEYHLLCLWLKQKKVTLKQAINLIRSVIAEVLFDVAQAADVAEQVKPAIPLSTPLKPIQLAQVIADAQAQLRSWQQVKLTEYSPNNAPIIKQPERLQAQCPPQVYQNLTRLLNGQHSLRDLAVETKRDVTEVTRSLLTYMQLQWVRLVNISDLPAPVFRRNILQPPPKIAAPTKGLIACVDDSALVRQSMEKLLVAAGYQFVGVEDGLRAIGVLLARRPDLIFLDLVMPTANGYEICEQLRKLSCFRETSIVILTGNDGFANRLRSNFVGATEFLSKPLDAEMVLSVVKKHLARSTNGS
ncbi:MAG: response regulator [Cyanothece sp. SIO1E1]|nr:response regulator [Cyanothece sp. SIO1E1]